jgi:hypothetical protein
MVTEVYDWFIGFSNTYTAMSCDSTGTGAQVSLISNLQPPHCSGTT